MTFREAIRYLDSFTNYEKIPAYSYKESLHLERIRDFLKIIGNPQDSLKCIHIAGTKGKGSTCAFIAYILRAAGFKVGFYTSPHLVDFRERIRIIRPLSDTQKATSPFEGMVTKRELACLVSRLKPAINKYNKISLYGPLTFFEVYTALAFVYFKEKKVDFVVLETGLGGRLDATNVVHPLVCAITPISLEHTDKLGDTLTKIAIEKAGIIKDNKIVVICAPQEEEARTVIRKRCITVGARLCEVGKNIQLTVKILKRTHKNLKIRLLGRHQYVNAAVSVGVVEALRNHNIYISSQAIRDGLSSTFWPGRCEIIAKNPLLVLDGAQNTASARVLKETIKKDLSIAGIKYKKLILVLGISSDKDIQGVCAQLCALAERIILTQANSPRAAKVNDLENAINSQKLSIKPKVVKTKSVREAITLAKKVAGRKDLILVTGSLFVVGEARKICVI